MREKQILPPVFLFSLSPSSSSSSPSSSSSISMHCLVNLFVVSCTIKPDVFSSCSVVLTRRTQGQLSNNIAACVCVSVCCRRDELFLRKVFWLSLRTKRASERERERREKENVESKREREREKKNEKEKEKMFLLLPVCWHSILVGV